MGFLVVPFVVAYILYQFIGWEWERVGYVALNFLLVGYPTYFLIRFIIWAVKTLKEK